MASRTFQYSFGGGEVAPEMYGRVDDAKRQSGLALCRNFIVKPHGPVENRPGTRFVREVKDSTKAVRLIPFTFSTTQTMVIEMGAGYFRFHTDGATLLSGMSPYEITNPYAEADLFDIHFVQSADVLTLVHPNYAPRELRRLAATNWTLTTIDFTAAVSAPGSVVATATTGSGTIDYSYVVTAVVDDAGGGASESEASSAGTCTNDLFTTGNKNTITWGSVVGASRYFVYKLRGGLYGYIGQTSTTSLVDDNIAPDMSKTPPYYDSLFAAAGDYPAAVSYFEQRRVFAGTNNQPQNVWMTRSGTEADMAYSIPTRDDDRIAVRVAAREANTIRHIVPLTQLILLTSAAEWQVTAAGADVITPTSIAVRPQSYIGASNVQPVIVGNNVLYVAARGSHVRELAYNWQAGGFITGDISLRAPHLFDGDVIVDLAYAKHPYPVVWCVTASGKLLGLTYVPEQAVWAWHQHDTDGLFESCTVVAEGQEDAVYVVARRTIGGNTVRYVERFASRQFDAQEDAYFMDCGLSYDGAAATVFSGLDHLEGETVSILADGAVHPQRVVASGSVTLDEEASVVHIGLPITSDVQTLPLAFQVDRGDGAMGQGRTKNVNKVWLRVSESSGIFAGPDANRLTEFKQRTTEPYGTPPALKTDEISLVLTPDWSRNGTVLIRQSDPLPLTLVSLAAEVAVGG